MTHFCGLVLSLLLLLGGARRNIHIHEFRDGAQRQSNTLSNRLEVSDATGEALIPGAGVARTFRGEGALRELFKQRAKVALQAASGPEEKDSKGETLAEESVEAPAEAMSAYKTFYDDEREDPAFQKPPVSDTMRKRLLSESRGLGADYNAKNPFLPVFFAVGIFVLLGAIGTSF